MCNKEYSLSLITDGTCTAPKPMVCTCCHSVLSVVGLVGLHVLSHWSVRMRMYVYTLSVYIHTYTHTVTSYACNQLQSDMYLYTYMHTQDASRALIQACYQVPKWSWCTYIHTYMHTRTDIQCISAYPASWHDLSTGELIYSMCVHRIYMYIYIERE